MADEHFHEIQFSGKQLVFLFMATAVVAVVIFLTGVMVARVRAPRWRTRRRAGCWKGGRQRAGAVGSGILPRRGRRRGPAASHRRPAGGCLGGIQLLHATPGAAPKAAAPARPV